MANVSSSNGIEKYPKLRFESFLEEWKEISFCDLFTYVSNNTLSRADINYEIGRYQNIHYGDVLINFGPFLDANTNTLPFINLASEKNFDNMLLQDGDIIIADTAEDETVGKATEIINTSSRKIVSGLHTIACRPKIKMMPTYLGFYLNSEAYHKQLYALMQGIKVLSISKSNIETTIIKYPCIAEQEKVCSLLCLIEKRINKQKQLIEHIKKYKRGLQFLVFEKNQNNNWDKKTLLEIASFCGGGTPSKDIKDYWSGEIGWISSSDLDEEWIDSLSITRHITQSAIDNSATKLCPKGTISVVSRVGVGKVVVMPENLCTSQDFINITSIDGDTNFFAYQIAYKMKIQATKTQGTSIKGVTSETLKAMVLDIPSLEEQKHIATMLSTFDVRLKAEIKTLNKMQFIKNGLLQQLFI